MFVAVKCYCLWLAEWWVVNYHTPAASLQFINHLIVFTSTSISFLKYRKRFSHRLLYGFACASSCAFELKEKFYSFRRKKSIHGAVFLNLNLTVLIIHSNWALMRFGYSVQPTKPYIKCYDLITHESALTLQTFSDTYPRARKIKRPIRRETFNKRLGTNFSITKFCLSPIFVSCRNVVWGR